LSTPANASNQASTSVTFTWNASPTATQYYLVVSTSSTLAYPRKFDNFVSGTSQTVTGLPNDGTTYYWAVFAINAAGWSPMSTKWSFVNGSASPTPPAAPTLLTPRDLSNQASTSVTFTWNSSSGATQYYLVVSTSSTLGYPRKFDNFVSGTSQTVTGLPNNGTTYYWGVFALNGVGWSPMSTKWSFVNGP
jgi:hypothetical protein